MLAKLQADNKFVIETEVPCYDVDSAFRLKPASFMDMAQEIAYRAATEMHFGYEDLKKENKAWVLSRLHFRFLSHPLWRDAIKLYTWHKGPYGPFYLRDFRMEDCDGKEMVQGTSSWVILDLASRRMCRTSEIMEMVPESTICHEDCIAEPAGKVMMPKGCVPEKVASHKVEYSDIDVLGHTNNAKYVVWAMDCLDFGELAARPVSEVEICFNHETHPNEVVDLYKYSEEIDGKTVTYIEGKKEDLSTFCVKLIQY